MPFKKIKIVLLLSLLLSTANAENLILTLPDLFAQLANTTINYGYIDINNSQATLLIPETATVSLMIATIITHKIFKYIALLENINKAFV